MRHSTRQAAGLRAPLAATALAALWSAAAPLGAQAAVGNTSGNAIVRNTISVSYTDAMGKNSNSASASVDVTVTTVSATPVVATGYPTPSAGNTDGIGATQSFTVRLITTSNGPRAVALTAAYNTSSSTPATTNISQTATPVPPAPSGFPASIFLGATIIDPTDTNGTIASWPVGGSVTFKVPNDNGVPSDTAETGGAIGDGVVNGLKSGDMVYLYGGSSYNGPFSVGTVTDVPPGASSTAAADSIQLINNLGAPAYTNLATAPGWQILEAKDVTVTAAQGTVTDPTQPSNLYTTLTAQMGTSGQLNVPLFDQAHSGKIAVTKYVRNATVPMVGSSPYPAVTINGTTYSTANNNAFYSSGVTGKPGDNLEYLAVITNVGTGSSTAVTASDIVPTYTSLTLWLGNYGTAGAGTIFAHALLNSTETNIGGGGTGNIAVGYGSYTGTTAGSTMTLDLGNNSSTTTGGTLTSGQSAYVIYQTKIN